MSYHENSRKTFVAGAAIANQSVVKLGTSGVESVALVTRRLALWRLAPWRRANWFPSA